MGLQIFGYLQPDVAQRFLQTAPSGLGQMLALLGAIVDLALVGLILRTFEFDLEHALLGVLIQPRPGLEAWDPALDVVGEAAQVGSLEVGGQVAEDPK